MASSIPAISVVVPARNIRTSVLSFNLLKVTVTSADTITVAPAVLTWLAAVTPEPPEILIVIVPVAMFTKIALSASTVVE